MTQKQALVECVPNFSEGRDPSIIEKICGAIEQTPDTQILHTDMGWDAHRTVITFVATPDRAVDAGFAAIEIATRLIDMRTQKGAHPRIGATDVFPFVPLFDTDFDRCVILASRLGRRVSNVLGIPVYLYGHAARMASRMRVPDIRKGGLEALQHRMKSAEFAPDFGPISLPLKSGATMVGVRDFLLAYNVNLSTTDVAIAKQIARVLRASGYVKRDIRRRVIRDETGQAVRIPGRLAGCQADGWFMPSFGCAQVTMNLLAYRETGLHTAYEAVKEEARRRGLDVAGSELIGMVPKQALCDAGRYYHPESGSDSVNDDTLIKRAIDRLGLSAITPFDPQLRILENAINR